MTKAMALKKFAKKLDFKVESARSGREYHPVFFFLKLEGKSFHHRPPVKKANRSGATRNTEFFWYPDLVDRALAEGWTPREERDKVPWVRKDTSIAYERAMVLAKTQLPTKRKRNTDTNNSRASDEVLFVWEYQ
jgi:hypothetical protein